MPGDHDDELKREIQTHLELEAEERVADGMSVAAVIAFVAIIACLVPALRATRFDPIAALREE